MTMFIYLCLGSTANAAIAFPGTMGASALAVGVHGVVLISNDVTRSAIAKVKGLVTCKMLKMERRVENMVRKKRESQGRPSACWKTKESWEGKEGGI